MSLGESYSSHVENEFIDAKQLPETGGAVGMGNYKDSKLELLSKKGNGNFAYLDNLLEAEKVLATELTQTIYSVAFLNALSKKKKNASNN